MKIWGSKIVSDDDTTQVNRQTGKDTKHCAVYCLTDLQLLISVQVHANISTAKKMQAIHYTLVCAYKRIRINDILLGSMTHKNGQLPP
jgi:hypothetical protein